MSNGCTSDSQMAREYENRVQNYVCCISNNCLITNTSSSLLFFLSKSLFQMYLPVAYKGVLVSLKPRKTPCMASETATAGDPSALSVRYFLAGTSIGDPCIHIIISLDSILIYMHEDFNPSPTC